MDDANLTATRVRELLHYNPDTGIFTWQRRPLWMFRDLRSCEAWNGRYAGKTAGGISNGYLSIRIINRAYFAHRIAWLYVHGEWPAKLIDHRNTIPMDNRLSNLREADHKINAENRRLPLKRSQKMPLGVFFNSRKKERRYSANIRILGKTKHLGYFDSPEDAHSAYLEAKRTHHLGCTI